MADKQETTADIRKEAEAKFRELIEAWMQRRSTFQTTLGAMHAFNNVFDRLEVAHKSELSKNVSKNGADFGQVGNAAKLREAISTLRTALKEIRDDVLDMVMNHKSEDPDSYAHGLCLSIGGACDMALNSTKGLDYGNE